MIALLLLPRVGWGQSPDSPSTSSGESSDSTVPSRGSQDDASPSGSYQTRAVLWIFQERDIDAGDLGDFREGLREAVASGDRTHLLDDEDRRRHLERQGSDVPRCFQGLDTCESPRAVVYDQLGIHLTVELRLTRDGNRFRAAYEAIDRRGRVTRSAELRKSDLRRLAFGLARDLFDAAGRVSIRTTPSDAEVVIDAESVGQTPLDLQLPVGQHTYTIRRSNYQSLEGTFELTSAGSRTIRRELDKQPGQLRIEGAPEGAEVYVQDREVGRVGTPIELQPGTYTIEVRADGYVPYRDSVDVAPDETVAREASMTPQNPLLRDVPSEAIAVNHYMARLSFEQTIHPTTFRDARGWRGEDEYEFRDFTTRNGNPTSELTRATTAPSGVRLDFVYTGRRLGVTALSLSYLAGHVGRRAVLERRGGDKQQYIVEARTLHRLEIRPLQVSYRHLFGNFAPFGELGTGITFQWLRTTHPSFERPLSMRQTEAFWTLGAGVQYFFKPRWFFQARYGLQDYFNYGKGVEHALTLGMGLALPNVFGFEPEPPEEL